jgi:hypothetical protein
VLLAGIKCAKFQGLAFAATPEKKALKSPSFVQKHLLYIHTYTHTYIHIYTYIHTCNNLRIMNANNLFNEFELGAKGAVVHQHPTSGAPSTGCPLLLGCG